MIGWDPTAVGMYLYATPTRKYGSGSEVMTGASGCTSTTVKGSGGDHGPATAPSCTRARHHTSVSAARVAEMVHRVVVLPSAIPLTEVTSWVSAASP